MKSKRIAISGKIASGKTTTANTLVNDLGYKRVSFADPIKKIGRLINDYKLFGSKCDSPKQYEPLADMVAQLCEGDVDDIEKCYEIISDLINKYSDHDLTIKDDKTRAFMQELGQGLKVVNKYIWAEYLVNHLPSGNIVIDDLRFKTEYELVKKYGFTTVRLEITDKEQLERASALYGNMDTSRFVEISEVDLDDAIFDYTIPSKSLEYKIRSIKRVDELLNGTKQEDDEQAIWKKKIDGYATHVRNIVIPVDLNPAIARTLIHSISEILSEVIQDYHLLKSTLNGITLTVSAIEKKNLVGKNIEDRKRNATLAVENVRLDDGTIINLYDEQTKVASLLSRMESIRETILAQQSLLVSMNGFMKLERDVYTNEVR